MSSRINLWKKKAFCGERNRHCTVCIKNAVISLLHNGEDKFLKNLYIPTFLYLQCGWGFNCLYGVWTKRCLISWSLCDNPENNFGPHKAPHHTWHIWTSPFATSPSHDLRFVGLQSCQNSLWCVPSLPILVDTGASLPTGMDGHGSCPAHESGIWTTICEEEQIDA